MAKKISDLPEATNIGTDDIVWVDKYENGQLKSKRFKLLSIFSKLKTVFGSSLFGSGDIDSPKDGKLYGRKDGDWEEVDNKSANVPSGTIFESLSGEDENYLPLDGREIDSVVYPVLHSLISPSHIEGVTKSTGAFTGYSKAGQDVRAVCLASVDSVLISTHIGNLVKYNFNTRQSLGISWSFQAPVTALHMTSDGRLFAAAGGVLYFSTDEGLSFEVVDDTPSFTGDIVYIESSESILLLGSKKEVFITPFDNYEFENISTSAGLGTIDITAIAFTEDIIIIGGRGAVRASFDLGASYTDLSSSSGFIGSSAPINILISKIGGIYIIGSRMLKHSIDSGINFYNYSLALGPSYTLTSLLERDGIITIAGTGVAFSFADSNSEILDFVNLTQEFKFTSSTEMIRGTAINLDANRTFYTSNNRAFIYHIEEAAFLPERADFLIKV